MLSEKEIKAKIESGYIRFRAILEILGKPKEHVEESMEKYIGHIEENKEIDVIEKYISETEDKDDMFATFAEMEVLVKDYPSLIGFCFDYMPSSIDIIEPQELNYKSSELTEISNDLQARLHQLDMMIKQTKMENDFLKFNLSKLFKNTVSILLTNGPKDIEIIAKAIGTEPKGIQNILDELEKDGKIIKEENTYSLKK